MLRNTVRVVFEVPGVWVLPGPKTPRVVRVKLPGEKLIVVWADVRVVRDYARVIPKLCRIPWAFSAHPQ